MFTENNSEQDMPAMCGIKNTIVRQSALARGRKSTDGYCKGRKK